MEQNKMSNDIGKYFFADKGVILLVSEDSSPPFFLDDPYKAFIT